MHRSFSTTPEPPNTCPGKGSENRDLLLFQAFEWQAGFQKFPPPLTMLALTSIWYP